MNQTSMVFANTFMVSLCNIFLSYGDSLHPDLILVFYNSILQSSVKILLIVKFCEIFLMNHKKNKSSGGINTFV